MSRTLRVTERQCPVSLSPGATAAGGVLRGVVICGLTSANGRVYPAEVLRRAVKKYEGANVYLDHSGDRNGRGVREWFGELRDVRSRSDGRPEADLHYDTANGFAAEFESRAKNFPKSLGLSHVVMCTTRRDREGRDVVEDIREVESVDLVASPATNTSLTESKGSRPVTTLRAVLEKYRGLLKESARQQAARKLLLVAEDDAGMGAMLDAPADEPAEGTDPDQAIDDAFKQAMHAQVDALLDESHTLADFISKCRELFKSRAKIMGKAEPKDVGDGGAEPKAEEGRRVDYPALLKECRLAGYAPSDLDLVAMGGMTADQRREYVGERRGGGGAETPLSAGRERAGAAAVKEQAGAGAAASKPLCWQD